MNYRKHFAYVDYIVIVVQNCKIIIIEEDSSNDNLKSLNEYLKQWWLRPNLIKTGVGKIFLFK